MRDEMGEWMVQVPVKLNADTVARIDEDVKRFQPFCEGRSSIARLLLHLAYAAIDEGILGWDLESIQALLGDRQSTRVPGVPGTGFVYFIGNETEGPIKIGFSSHPEGRCVSISQTTPQSVKVLGKFRATRGEESALHERFKKDRMHGEWFKRTPELLAAFSSGLKPSVLTLPSAGQGVPKGAKK